MRTAFSLSFGLAFMIAGSTLAQDRTCKTADPASDQVFLYEGANYTGTCVMLQKFGTNIANVTTIGLANDSLSSVKVGDGVRLLACRDFDWKGDCQSHLQNWPDMSNTTLKDNQISAVKVLQKREAAQLHLANYSDKTVVIYEKVGGVDSYLGTLTPKGGGIIGSDINTSIVGKIDGVSIGGGFQIKSAGKTEVVIKPNDKGVVNFTVK